MSIRSFQWEVLPWLHECFGAEIATDPTERVHRFLEEAIELAQAGSCTASEAHQLVDYVFGRDMGDITQEIGGVMVTLAAFAIAHDRDIQTAAEAELRRVWANIDKIRAKQAAKPKIGPLPGHASRDDGRCVCGHKRQQHGVIKHGICYECPCKEFNDTP